MRVLCFQEWCVPLIKDGTKYSTIRRKANCQPGDVLSLRYWDGKPRRKGSRQVEFAWVVCKEIKLISIIDITDCLNFFEQEGFLRPAEMRDFFHEHYGLPFAGEMIEWEPLSLESIADRLSQREESLNKTIEKIEKAQRVPQALMDLEITT